MGEMGDKKTSISKNKLPQLKNIGVAIQLKIIVLIINYYLLINQISEYGQKQIILKYIMVPII